MCGPNSSSGTQAYNRYSGLGIGTTPAALATHGIDTTVVEIDPEVVNLAKEHFHIPEKKLDIIVEDAEVFVNKALETNETKLYDYVVHDVFTGGVEPSALFTREFMQQLAQLLKEDGVIAIVSMQWLFLTLFHS